MTLSRMNWYTNGPHFDSCFLPAPIHLLLSWLHSAPTESVMDMVLAQAVLIDFALF